MKKIFYKILLAFLVCSYIPVLVVLIMHCWYTSSYIESEKKNELQNIVKSLNIEELKKENKTYNNGIINIKYENLAEKDKRKEYYRFIKILNKQLDIENMKVDSIEVGTIKLSSITNHYYLIKKLSKDEIIVARTEMIKPDVIFKIMVDFYKIYSIIVIPLIFILAYFISKKFAEPIETLEMISTRMSKMDFSQTVEIVGKNELSKLANNINKMGSKLKDNIEELNILNKKLNQELKEKKALMEEQKMFMRAMGHEIKTPVAIINGYIEALQDKMIAKDEIDKIYGIIYSEAMSIDKLLKDMSNYLKIETQIFKPNYEEIELKKFLEKNLEKYKLDIEQKNITLVTDFDDEIVSTDVEYLNIIFNNLLTNAITYSDKRGEIGIFWKNKELTLENSAEYISDEALKKMFNPFYKGDTSRNRKYGGTGLGLSIVKNILTTLNLKKNLTYDKERGYLVFKIRFN